MSNDPLVQIHVMSLYPALTGRGTVDEILR